VHKPDLRQVVVPLARNAGDPATQLVAFLQTLVPPPAGEEAPAGPPTAVVRSRG
jgi:hypothetical protein